MEEGWLRVSPTCRIPLHELDWRFSASGGPGGQHANKAATRAEVIFDVEGSETLGPRQRARLAAKLGTTVRVTAADERSQSRNRAIALERLKDRLAQALKVDTPRRPTRPTRASKERRLDSKARRSAIKHSRRSPGDE